MCMCVYGIISGLMRGGSREKRSVVAFIDSTRVKLGKL